MRRLFLGVAVFWILLVILSAIGSSELFPTDLKVSDVSINWQSGGAKEHTELILMEIGEDAALARMIAKPTLTDMAHGSVSPLGWKAYVSQDAVSSWKGSGLASYALWS